MVDKLEKMSIQDLAFAKELGMDINDVEELSLHQMKNEMFHKAFTMRDNKQVITQEEANLLNDKLNSIINELCSTDYDYDPCEDYIVDFDCFVKENKQYNKFCW
jgi:precorrin-6B methylase 1